MPAKIVITIGMDGNKIQYNSDYEGNVSPFEYGEMIGALTKCIEQMKESFTGEVPTRLATAFCEGYEHARENFKPQANNSSVIYKGKVD